jgi:dihydrofolate reductase
MGYTTWLSIGKPLPNRLNIVLSKTHELEAEPNLLLLRSVDDVVQMSEFLNGDIYIIGGAHTYVAFADVIKKWIVTEIPETVNDADAFMPEDFLNGFSITQTRELTDGLTVRFYEKTSK